MDDWTYSFRGLVFGTGTDYPVTMHGAFEDFIVRSSDQPFPRADGDIPGDHYAAGRHTIMVIRTLAPHGDVQAERLAALRQAFQMRRRGHDALTFKRPGEETRMVRARVLRRERIRDALGWKSAPGYAVELKRTDPRVYRAEPRSVLLQPFTGAGGGLDYPIDDYPKEYAAATAQQFDLTLGGDWEANPRLVFQVSSGTATRLEVQNLTNGDEVVLTTSVSSGSQLALDLDAYVTDPATAPLTLDGVARPLSEWERPHRFRLEPGSNVLRFLAIGSTDVVCRVTARDTFM